MFKNPFAKKEIKDDVTSSIPSPLGLRINGIVTVDTLYIELFFGGQNLMDLSMSKNIQITSYSKIVIDDDTCMHRFNFNGGFFEIIGDIDGQDFDFDSLCWYHSISTEPLLHSNVDTWINDEIGLVGSPFLLLMGLMESWNIRGCYLMEVTKIFLFAWIQNNLKIKMIL